MNRRYTPINADWDSFSVLPWFGASVIIRTSLVDVFGSRVDNLYEFAEFEECL